MKQVTRCIAITVLVHLASCQRAGQRYVIIHADDAGMCDSVNEATIKAMESGLVSSASIMVPCPAFEAIASYAAAHLEKDFGVHLVLNAEWEDYRWGPVTPPDRVPSLIDSDGYLWKSGELVATNVKADEAEIELRAQIERARQHGIRISHLDSHMFSLFTRPDLIKLFVKLGVENKVPVLIPRRPDTRQLTRYPHFAPMLLEATRVLGDHDLPMVDFLDSRSYGVAADGKREHYLRYMRSLKPGVTELIIHCGMNDAELARITPSAARRYADFRVFTSNEMAEELQVLDIQITNWRQMRKLSRANGDDSPQEQHHAMAEGIKPLEGAETR